MHSLQAVSLACSVPSPRADILQAKPTVLPRRASFLQEFQVRSKGSSQEQRLSLPGGSHPNRPQGTGPTPGQGQPAATGDQDTAS